MKIMSLLEIKLFMEFFVVRKYVLFFKRIYSLFIFTIFGYLICTGKICEHIII